MAAKKSTETGTVKISGAVRHGGQVYVAGDEEKLAKKLKESGVDSVRGFGVDSTDRGTKAVRNDSRRAEIAARAAQAQAEASGESGGDEGDTDYASVPLADLAASLEAVNDKKTLQRLKRRDKRSGSKSIYAARLDAIQSAAGDSGETDASDDGTDEE